MSIDLNRVPSEISAAQSPFFNSVLLEYGFILKPDVMKVATGLDMPICAIALPGPCFLRVVAAIGTDLTLIHRDHAFCTHMARTSDALVVQDAAVDAMFRHNPYVLDGPCLRFYAAVRLRGGNGSPIGSLCVADYRPRRFSDKARIRMMDAAHAIARKISDEVEEALRLRRLDKDHLLELLQAEPPTNKERLIQLSAALYARLDQD